MKFQIVYQYIYKKNISIYIAETFIINKSEIHRLPAAQKDKQDKIYTLTTIYSITLLTP